MALKDIELRILGSLIEKQYTTPENYPLTSNSLLLACNQKSSRDPVSDYILHDIEYAMQDLRDKGLVSSQRGIAERSVKHEHRLDKSLQLSKKGFALLAVLMLRGPQTPGELRSRTERYTQFQDLADVEQNLQKLLEHHPSLVKNLGRGPGQSQDRWMHTLGVSEEQQRPRVRNNQPSATPQPTSAAPQTDLEQLRAELDAVKLQLQEIKEHLGL